MIQKFQEFVSINESKDIDGAIEDIFFIWDEEIDDDRKGITGGHTTYEDKKCFQFNFSDQISLKEHENFMKFLKRAEKSLKE